ncbi:MAG: chromosome segregation SMC family protein [Bdellovibrionota bacterium]|jgi:chromosome segregation protein
MQIVRLELFGFKSFMERTVLPLAGGVTGVVGPNGCGKSNVVDAARWVLGETRARSLRGELLEDVIFNGTDKLRPLGLAEVSLTLRSEEKDFFADLISPTLEADLFVMSEELNAENALNAERQPEEGQVVSLGQESAKENENDFEEHLASSDGEESNSLDTSSTLEESQAVVTEDEYPNATSGASAALLQKFSWLKSVNEVQITRRLYRSGESEFFLNRVPCRLKDLREFCRAVGMGPRAYTIVAQGEITRIVTAKPEERRAILEEAAGVQGFRDKIIAAQRRLEDTDLNLTRFDDIIKEVSRQVLILKRQAAKARNRQQLKEEIKRLDNIIFVDTLSGFNQENAKICAELESAGQEEAELSNSLRERQNLEEEVRSGLMNIDVLGDELRSGIDQIKSDLAARDRARGERLAKIGELKALISGSESELQNLQDRRVKLEQRRLDCDSEIKDLNLQNEALNKERSSIEHLSGGDVARLGEEIDRKRKELRQKELGVREFRDEVVALKATFSSLSDQLVDVSPVAKLKRLMNGDSDDTLLPPSMKVLAEVMHVPAHLVKAVQVALREKASFVVVEDPHQLMLKLKELTKDEENSLGIGAVATSFRANIQQTRKVPFKPLLDSLKIDTDFEPLLHSLLHDIYLVGSLEEAADYFSSEEGKDDLETKLVTPTGCFITKNSFSELSTEVGIIQTKNKLEEIQARLTDCEAKHQGAETECESLRTAIETLEKDQLAALSESDKVQQQILELGKKSGEVQGRLGGLYNVKDELEDDFDLTESKILDAENRLDALQYRLDSAEDELENATTDQDSALEEELAKRVAEYEGLERRRQEKRLQMNEVMRVVEDLRQQVDALRIKGAGLELRKQKIALSVTNLKEKVFAEYGEEDWGEIESQLLNYEPLEDFVRDEYEEELIRLRARLLREGEVDPESIPRLAEEQNRLEELEKQKADLERASAILKKTISRLVETSVERFMSTFDAVKSNFERLIPRLFDGGQGTLSLADPSNPLETGLELTVRPPGKRLKSIELLSGGEKGLCAVALIFSMFLQRPSPLCILDEVDAPFDEVNLSRFIDLLKEMSTKTQFIMITHNKQSMAACDNLVGVTMQEPGASKILTVSLEEAYDHVA